MRTYKICMAYEANSRLGGFDLPPGVFGREIDIRFASEATSIMCLELAYPHYVCSNAPRCAIFSYSRTVNVLALEERIAV